MTLACRAAFPPTKDCGYDEEFLSLQNVIATVASQHNDARVVWWRCRPTYCTHVQQLRTIRNAWFWWCLMAMWLCPWFILHPIYYCYLISVILLRKEIYCRSCRSRPPISSVSPDFLPFLPTPIHSSSFWFSGDSFPHTPGQPRIPNPLASAHTVSLLCFLIVRGCLDCLRCLRSCMHALQYSHDDAALLGVYLPR